MIDLRDLGVWMCLSGSLKLAHVGDVEVPSASRLRDVGPGTCAAAATSRLKGVREQERCCEVRLYG